MEREEAQRKIAELLAAATGFINQAKTVANENGVSFTYALDFDGTYEPKDPDDDETEYQDSEDWESSSNDC